MIAHVTLTLTKITLRLAPLRGAWRLLDPGARRQRFDRCLLPGAVVKPSGTRDNFEKSGTVGGYDTVTVQYGHGQSLARHDDAKTITIALNDSFNYTYTCTRTSLLTVGLRFLELFLLLSFWRCSLCCWTMLVRLSM